MSLFALPFPAIDPVLIQLGPFAIRWYALAYIAGLLAGWRLVLRFNAQAAILDRPQTDDLLVWCVLGTVLGGRVGYVLFYNLPFFLADPTQILMVWQGGMSFHGGLIGVTLAVLLFCRRRGKPFLPVMDQVACVVPIGLFLGRLANFVNGELWGRPTDVAWAVVFPHAGPEPRHPSQLYEAGLEGLALLAVMLILRRAAAGRLGPGFLSGLFLVDYALFRAFAELFREPDAQLGFLAFGTTMGQLLCVPMALVGVATILYALRHRPGQPA